MGLEKIFGQVPDFSKIIFLHSEYLKYVLLASAATLLVYALVSQKTWSIYKSFGGFDHCRGTSKKRGVGITGPLKLALKAIFMTLVTTVAGLTLLGPRQRDQRLETEYEPTEIEIALDYSLSMLAEDIEPSRIEFTKRMIHEVLERLKQEGQKDKVGLIKFSDIAIPVVAIPTKDYNAVERELRRTTVTHLKMATAHHGTNLWDAVTWGLKSFDQENKLVKILILISDGEQVAENDYIDKTRKEALDERSKNSDVKIFIASIGNQESATLIPKEKDERGNVTEYFTQTEGTDKGKFIETRPSPAYMSEVADLISGLYIPSSTGKEVSEAVREILDKERRVIGRKENPNYKDVSPFFITVLLILLIPIPFLKL